MKKSLGVRYDFLDYSVRTWHTDRIDYHMDNLICKERNQKYDKKIFRKDLTNDDLFTLSIFENREWNPYSFSWIPDSRFVVDFAFFWNSSLKVVEKKGNYIRKGIIEKKQLIKIANFIKSIKIKDSSWGLKNTIRTRINGRDIFKVQYPFNYYIEDVEKRTEMMKFDFSVYKENSNFVVEFPEYQNSKKINQEVDIIMTGGQLKEFGNFLFGVTKRKD